MHEPSPRSMFSPTRRKAGILAALATVTVLGGANASAAVLAKYDFGTVDTPTYNSVDTDPNSVATAFTPASGLGTGADNWPTSNNGIFTGEGNPAPEFAQKPTGVANSQAEALSNNSYWSFTISPEAGHELDLDSLTFDILVVNASFPINYYVSTSLAGGFASPVGAVVTGATGNFTVARAPIDLSGAAYQNITGTVEVRMYLWSPESGGTGGSRWAFDNITLNGTASLVPEPGSLALMAGLVLLSGLRTRGRQTPFGAA